MSRCEFSSLLITTDVKNMRGTFGAPLRDCFCFSSIPSWHMNAVRSEAGLHIAAKAYRSHLEQIVHVAHAMDALNASSCRHLLCWTLPLQREDEGAGVPRGLSGPGGVFPQSSLLKARCPVDGVCFTFCDTTPNSII